jgi:hypothetical protein
MSFTTQETMSIMYGNSTIFGFSTIAGLSTASNVYDPNTFQRISTPVNILFSTYSNITGYYSNLNIVDEHYEHFSFDISTLKNLTVTELHWLEVSTTIKYLNLLNPDHAAMPMPPHLYDSSESTILNAFSTGIDHFDYDQVWSNIISNPIISTFMQDPKQQ